MRAAAGGGGDLTTPEQRQAAAGTARALVEGLRAAPARGGVQALVHEYALSSEEGAAMCLAEALLRIPDTATRDALIRDKIAGGDWAAHLGHGARCSSMPPPGPRRHRQADRQRQRPRTRGGADPPVARVGEPVIRRGVDIAMRMMGEQFVTGQTIEEALRRSKEREAAGFGFSYDMLGEAATTAADAQRYLADYRAAIHAIGKASAWARAVCGAGHLDQAVGAASPLCARAGGPRHGRVAAARAELARLAKGYDIGFNIDAEEADLGWSCRSTCCSRSPRTRRWRGGTASASWCRPMASAARW
ncbi:proline dehydrogenase family protein [Sphingomonas sp. MMS24-JH45]